MQKKLVASTLGKLMVIIGFSMIIPLVTSVIYREREVWVFLVCMPLMLAAGFAMYYFCKTDGRLRAKDGFAIVTYGWVIASLFGALPYVLCGVLPNFLDAFLETMSGFTTTGATVFNEIDHLPHGILMWRSLTHWLGGMGIVVLFVAILSSLGTGGMQIVKAEMPGPISEKIKPRISDSAKILWVIYISITLLNIVALMFCGMSLFDAITHAFSTIATGGFSTKTESLGYYHNPAIEWVTIFFMFFSGVNFALYYHMVKGRSLLVFWQSKVFRGYMWIVLVATALISVDLIQIGRPVLEAVRSAMFHVVSIMTTTGFITEDFDLWPPMAVAVLLCLMMIGACAGSTGGGIKVDRWLILLEQALHELHKALHPRLVTRLKVNRTPISDGLIINVASFFFLYIVIVIFATLTVTAFGYDIASSFSVTVTCLGNVGPGIGAFGPVESLAAVPGPLKLMLSFLMLLGRLELFTVLVVLVPTVKKTSKSNRE